MPCPYFEPQAIVGRTSVRLPLLDEYRGLCHGTTEPTQVPDDVRLRCCNHGYSRGVCSRLPATEASRSIRFDVIKSTPETLELLYVEERDYAPYRWQIVRFDFCTESIEPQIADACASAQITAFGRSFIRRFRRIPVTI